MEFGEGNPLQQEDMRGWPIAHVQILGQQIMPVTKTIVERLAALSMDRAESCTHTVVREHAA